MNEYNYKSYESIIRWFSGKKLNFLVTGAAGFIGTNLVLKLLELGQNVTGADNFLTGKRSNIALINELHAKVAKDADERKGGNFSFIECDLRDINECRRITAGIDFVFHEAGLGSVPWSLEDPLLFHADDDTAFFNILNASKENAVKKLIYASSSAVYGTCKKLPAVENKIGGQVSMYASAKLTNEIYAKTFYNVFGFESIGFRYFNIYGDFQDPDSKYAAVIPAWIKNILGGKTFIVNGDGKTTRDFCYVDDVVKINLLGVIADKKYAEGSVYNAASGSSVTLKDLAEMLVRLLNSNVKYEFGPFRQGDIKYSAADITKAKNDLGYFPGSTLEEGLEKSLNWYKKVLKIH